MHHHRATSNWHDTRSFPLINKHIETATLSAQKTQKRLRLSHNDKLSFRAENVIQRRHNDVGAYTSASASASAWSRKRTSRERSLYPLKQPASRVFSQRLSFVSCSLTPHYNLYEAANTINPLPHAANTQQSKLIRTCVPLELATRRIDSNRKVCTRLPEMLCLLRSIDGVNRSRSLQRVVRCDGVLAIRIPINAGLAFARMNLASMFPPVLFG